MTKKNYTLLQNLYKNKISEELSLTEAERAAGVAAAKAHYKLLADSGNKYGNLALEVVNNNGEWGKMANKHLEHQAVFEGINELAVPTVRDNIIISLAHMDIIARKGDNIQNDLKAIGIYHKEVFRRQISEYAWGGLLFEEIKTGLWMDIYIKNEGRYNLASAVMQTTKEASKALSSGRLKTEYSIERMTQTMLYTAGRASGNNFTGNSTSFSKEGVAKSWGVDVSQVVLLDPYVGVHNAVVPFSKFIIKPANPLISKPTSSVIATPAPVVAESSEEQKTEHKQSSDSENNKISEDLVLRLNMLFSTPQSQSNSSSSLTPQVNSFSDLLTSLKAKSILDSALKEFRSKFDAILDKFHNKIKEELKTLAKEDNDLQQNNGQAEYDAKSQIILQKAQQAVSNMVQQQQLSYDSQVTAIAQQKKGECSAFFQQKSSEHAAEFGFQKMCAEISQSASTSGGCIVLDSSGIAAAKNAEVQAFNSQKQSELEMFQSNLKQQIDSQLKTMIAAKQLEAQAECIALKASIESRLNSNKSAQTNKIKTAVQKEKSKTEEFNNKVTDILSNSELLDRIKDALENNTNADIIATQELDVFLTGAEVDFGVS